MANFDKIRDSLTRRMTSYFTTTNEKGQLPTKCIPGISPAYFPDRNSARRVTENHQCPTNCDRAWCRAELWRKPGHLAIVSMDPFVLDLKAGREGAVVRSNAGRTSATRMQRTPFLTGAMLNGIVESGVCARARFESSAWPIGCDRTSGEKGSWRRSDRLIRMPNR